MKKMLSFLAQVVITGNIGTVVKLVRKKPDAYIDIIVDMDELDLTASEASYLSV